LRVCAAGFITAGLVQYAAVFGGSRLLVNGYRGIVPLDILTALNAGTIHLAIYVFALYLRSRSVSYAKALVAADHRAYNVAWALCVQDSDSAAALQRIEVFVTAQWGHLGPELLCHRAREADLRAPPTESVEQLFAQASVLVVFLRFMTKGWAMRSQGRFPVLQSDGAGVASGAGGFVFERWEDIATDGDMVQRVKWPKVKSMKRAVEKIYRCYAGEVSRLVDVCRC
jgi:hypothetical protein